MTATCTMPSPWALRLLCSTQSKRAVLLRLKDVPVTESRIHGRVSPVRIPRVHISADEEGGKEIELSDDPYDCLRLDVENVPCIVTLCKVSWRQTFSEDARAARFRGGLTSAVMLRRWDTGTSWTRPCRRRRAPWPASSCPSHRRAPLPAHGKWAAAAWTRRASSR